MINPQQQPTFLWVVSTTVTLSFYVSMLSCACLQSAFSHFSCLIYFPRLSPPSTTTTIYGRIAVLSIHFLFYLFVVSDEIPSFVCSFFCVFYSTGETKTSMSTMETKVWHISERLSERSHLINSQRRSSIVEVRVRQDVSSSLLYQKQVIALTILFGEIS